MSSEPASAVAGNTVEWRLYNPRRQEHRTYVQGELSIEGEARLVGFARKVGGALGDAGYTFGELGDLFDETREVDWPKVMELLEAMSVYAPDLVADGLTIFFGIFPADEDGQPNPDYEDHRKFLRGAVNVARLYDIVQVFISQNEYARLIRPFSSTLAEAMDAYRQAPQSASPEASDAQAIVGTDGSTVLLEPPTPTDGTTTEPSESVSETSSEPSVV